jgi:hypothetical protein
MIGNMTIVLTDNKIKNLLVSVSGGKWSKISENGRNITMVQDYIGLVSRM